MGVVMVHKKTSVGIGLNIYIRFALKQEFCLEQNPLSLCVE